MRVTFFRLRGLESYGEFFFFLVWGRPATQFVRDHFCICARCLRPHKFRIHAHKQIEPAQMQGWRAHGHSAPDLAVSTHNYPPMVGRITRACLISKALEDKIQKESTRLTNSRSQVSKLYYVINRRIQIQLDDLIREVSDFGRPRSDNGRPTSDVGWTSSQLREELIGSRKILDLISDLGRPISGLKCRISGLRRPISGLGCPRSDIGWNLPDFGKNLSDLGRSPTRFRNRMSDPTKSEFT
jgi:hypothetical protein